VKNNCLFVQSSKPSVLQKITVRRFRSEQGFHEAIEESKKKTEPEMVPQEAESSEEILDFLKMIECCLILQNGKFDGLDQRGWNFFISICLLKLFNLHVILAIIFYDLRFQLQVDLGSQKICLT